MTYFAYHFDRTAQAKVDDTPNGRSRLIFAALCNDLIDYFIVRFDHQCNTMCAV